MGRISLWDVAKSSIAFAFLSLAMPLSLVRRRGVEATVTAQLRPFYETLSFALGTGTLILSIGIVQLADVTGWTVARTGWIVILCATLLGVAALTISGKFQLTLRRLLEPYLYTSRFDPEQVWGRLSHELDTTATRQELCRLIPARAAAITGVDPSRSSSPGTGARTTPSSEPRSIRRRWSASGSTSLWRRSSEARGTRSISAGGADDLGLNPDLRREREADRGVRRRLPPCP